MFSIAAISIQNAIIVVLLFQQILFLVVVLHPTCNGTTSTINPVRKYSFRRQNTYRKERRKLQENETTHGSINDDEQFQIAPIRIQYDTRMVQYKYNLTNETAIKNEITNILYSILPQAAQIWSKHLYIQRPIQRDARDEGNEISIDATDCGIDIDLDETIVNLLFPNITTYTNVDIVFIIGADLQNQCNARQLGYARVCTLDLVSDRPLVGIINFCFGGTKSNRRPTIYNIPLAPYYENYTGIQFQPDHLQISMLDVTLHEMTHIFGMSSRLFPYFRDDFGQPRMARDNETGWPISISRTCGDGTVMTNEFEDLPSDDLVAVESMDDGTYRQYMITPTVQTIVRNHFNCTTLLGARLGDSSSACISSHWHERHYYNDLMGPKASKSSANSLSLLTLALLADTGWYHVDFRNLQPELPAPTFGINAGCDFVSQSCIDNRTNQKADWAVNEFCDDPYLQLQPFNETSTPDLLNHNIYCDPGHRQWTLCDLVEYNDGTIPVISYFSSKTLGPLNITEADYCPIPDVGLGLDCGVDASTYEAFYPGERVGMHSRCINAFHYTTSSAGVNMKIARPACMVITCDIDAGIVRIGSGTTNVQNCTIDGQVVALPNRSDGAYIICPRLAVVCPDLYTCPNGCFGKGICVNQPTNNGRLVRPYCRCFNETNNDPSCAPSMFASTNSPPRNDTNVSLSIAPSMNVAPSNKSSSSPTIAPMINVPTSESVTSSSSYNDGIPHILNASAPSKILLLLLLYSATAFIYFG